MMDVGCGGCRSWRRERERWIKYTRREEERRAIKRSCVETEIGVEGREDAA